MKFLVVSLTVLAMISSSSAQFNIQQLAGLLGPVNTQSAGQCVNSQNALGNILICAAFGNRCGARSNNPVVQLAGQFAGQYANQLGALANNPVVCMIAQQSCCLSNNVNPGQLLGVLGGAFGGGNNGGGNFLNNAINGFTNGQFGKK